MPVVMFRHRHSGALRASSQHTGVGTYMATDRHCATSGTLHWPPLCGCHLEGLYCIFIYIYSNFHTFSEVMYMAGDVVPSVNYS